MKILQKPKSDQQAAFTWGPLFGALGSATNSRSSPAMVTSEALKSYPIENRALGSVEVVGY